MSEANNFWDQIHQLRLSKSELVIDCYNEPTKKQDILNRTSIMRNTISFCMDKLQEFILLQEKDYTSLYITLAIGIEFVSSFLVYWYNRNIFYQELWKNLYLLSPTPLFFINYYQKKVAKRMMVIYTVLQEKLQHADEILEKLEKNVENIDKDLINLIINIDIPFYEMQI